MPWNRSSFAGQDDAYESVDMPDGTRYIVSWNDGLRYVGVEKAVRGLDKENEEVIFDQEGDLYDVLDEGGIEGLIEHLDSAGVL